MKLLENLAHPDPEEWGRSPVAWHPDAEAGFTLKFDGPPLTLLNQHAPKGAANVGLAHVHDPGDTDASVRSSSTILSFNLSSTPGARASWRGAGRRFDYSVETGRICIAPPTMDVEGSNASPVYMLSIWVPDNLLSLAAGELNISRGSIIERVGIRDSRLFRLARSLHSELESGLPGGTMHWTELSAIFALQLVLRHMSEAAKGPSPSIGSTTLKRVNAFIAESLDRPITLDDLAMAAGLSKFHFLRAFTKTVGMTPSVYLMHRRVEVAIAMAKYGKEPFAEIAYATGFADHSHLSRWCRRVYGVRLTDIRGD